MFFKRRKVLKGVALTHKIGDTVYIVSKINNGLGEKWRLYESVIDRTETVMELKDIRPPQKMEEVTRYYTTEFAGGSMLVKESLPTACGLPTAFFDRAKADVYLSAAIEKEMLYYIGCGQRKIDVSNKGGMNDLLKAAERAPFYVVEDKYKFLEGLKHALATALLYREAENIDEYLNFIIKCFVAYDKGYEAYRKTRGFDSWKVVDPDSASSEC